MKYITGIFLVLLIAVFGCARRGEVKEETVSMEEEPVFEEVAPDTTDTMGIFFEEEPETDVMDTTILFEEDTGEEETAMEEETTEETMKTTQGYRVQIFASESKSSAENFASSAREKLAKKVYVQRIPPYYKVRVGNFLSQSEAGQYKMQVRNMGYSDAFVVESEIKTE